MQTANLAAFNGKMADNLVPGQAAASFSSGAVTTSVKKDTASNALTATVGGFSLKSFGSGRRNACGDIVSVSSVQITNVSSIGYTDTIGYTGGMVSASVLTSSGSPCAISGMSPGSQVCISGTFPAGSETYAGYYWKMASNAFATDGITIADGTGSCSGKMLTVTHLTDFTVGNAGASTVGGSSGDDGCKMLPLSPPTPCCMHHAPSTVVQPDPDPDPK